MRILICGYNGSERLLTNGTQCQSKNMHSHCVLTPVVPWWNHTVASDSIAEMQLVTTWQSTYMSNQGHVSYFGTSAPYVKELKHSSVIQVAPVGSSTVIYLEECQEVQCLHIVTDNGSSVSFRFLSVEMNDLRKISSTITDARKTPVIAYGLRKGKFGLVKFRLKYIDDVKGKAEVIKRYETNIKDMVAGREHYLFLTMDGQVMSCGMSSRGQLGHGNLDAVEEPQLVEAFEEMKITDISAGGWSSMALNEHGLVFVWGWNSAGALGFLNRGVREQNKEIAVRNKVDQQEVELIAEPRLLPLPEKVSHLSCGERHAAAVSVTGKVYVWGLNQHGQLGLGDCRTRDHPVLLSTIGESKISRVICGEWSTVLVQEETVPSEEDTVS